MMGSAWGRAGGVERVMAVRCRRGGPRAWDKVRGWAAYDQALVRRGDITVWVSPAAAAGWRAPAGHRTISDAAIAAALTVRRVPARAAAGRGPDPLDPRPLDLTLPIPDHTTLSRLGRTPGLGGRSDACRGRGLAIDSTGLRLAKPSGAGHEGWCKLHVAVDPDTGQILAKEQTRSDGHDTVPVPALLDRVTGQIGRVCGDAA
ncbi:hypothetical protein D9599_27935 [Roseomonas sp. KE2513]|uniref:transposase n=1 Tax=Roseomonas sp. KE2513 TaxID=2479202 RepID=UPI0018E00A06|nr:transposase [Roseomonas sp. KE2513]MBI0539359.1 hypothetical protein [Roseomonas sp. KE2513]